MVNKIWKLFSMGFMPLVVFLIPVMLSLHFHDASLCWWLFVSWIPALVGMLFMAAIHNQKSDEEMIEIMYKESKLRKDEASKSKE